MELKLKDSVWMFNKEFATYYSEDYDFVRFDERGVIEYLNFKGDVIKTEFLKVDKNGRYKILENEQFQELEIIDSSNINFIFHQEHINNGESVGLRETKYNYRKLSSSQIEVSKDELMRISKKSEWTFQNHKNKTIKFSNGKEISKDEIKKIIADPKRLEKHHAIDHLINLSGTIVYIKRFLRRTLAKAIVTKINANNLFLEIENKNHILNRIN